MRGNFGEFFFNDSLFLPILYVSNSLEINKVEVLLKPKIIFETLLIW